MKSDTQDYYWLLFRRAVERMLSSIVEVHIFVESSVACQTMIVLIVLCELLLQELRFICDFLTREMIWTVDRETVWLCPGIGRYSMDNYYYQDLEVSLRFGTGWCLLTNTQVFWKNALSLWRISERLRDWLCCKSLMTLATLTFLCECWSVWSSIWDWRCIKTVPSGIALDIADALFGIDYREAVIFIAVVVVSSTMLTDPSGQLNGFQIISQSHLVEPINVLYSYLTMNISLFEELVFGWDGRVTWIPW